MNTIAYLNWLADRLEDDAFSHLTLGPNEYAAELESCAAALGVTFEAYVDQIDRMWDVLPPEEFDLTPPPILIGAA